MDEIQDLAAELHSDCYTEDFDAEEALRTLERLKQALINFHNSKQLGLDGRPA